MAANTMEIDPFSTNSTMLEKSTKTHSFSSSLIGFYLCSFDTTHGLQILYSIPAKLRKNTEEHNILKTHYIWKVEHIPMRIDRKISEFVYSAFQLHQTNAQRMGTTFEKPIFGVVLKIWKDGEFIHPEELIHFRDDLQTTHWEDIETMYQRQILKLNPTKRRKYLQLSEKAVEIGEALQSDWENLGNKISDSRTFLTSQNLSIPKSSLQSSAQESPEKSLFKDPITMRVLKVEESSEEVLVILINQMATLEEVKIRVSKKTEFFSESLWEQNLEEWPTKEDLILEFPRSSKLESYMLKISSKNQTVAIKSLDIDPTDTML
ncbi:MAG: hypothetical protein ACW98F_02065 [Candidatus Hodarchaeales archaeon]|jgi:hypothetical protein